MNDLHSYLKLPETHRLYSVGLSLLQPYRENYPDQYKHLSSGPFGTNPEKLHQLLVQIAETPPAPIQPTPTIAITPTVVEVITEEKQTHRDALIRKVSQEIRAAYKLRNQLSDRFHDLATNEQRAENSDRIQAAEKDIKSLYTKLEYIKRTGKEPPTEEPENFQLPDTEAELAILQNRKQSHRRKIEKRIEFLLTLSETDKRRKTMPEKEEKLREVNIQLELIKQRRKWLQTNSK